MESKTYLIVKKGGKWLDWWQYSQGNFDTSFTTDPLKAVPIDQYQWDTFFKGEKGFILQRITASWAIERLES